MGRFSRLRYQYHTMMCVIVGGEERKMREGTIIAPMRFVMRYATSEYTAVVLLYSFVPNSQLGSTSCFENLNTCPKRRVFQFLVGFLLLLLFSFFRVQNNITMDMQ